MSTHERTEHSIRRPAVVLWFKAYAGFLCLLYTVLVAGVLYQPVAAWMEDDEDLGWIATIPNELFVALGIVLFIACFLPIVLPPRRWLWGLSLVIIGLGMTSACFLPICIPLLVFWLKSDTRAYYNGR